MASQSRRQFLKHGVGVSTLALLADSRPLFASKTALPLRPAVQGTLRLKSRRRELRGGKNGKVVVIAEPIDWKVSETAITICDMWADHPCHQAAIRVDAMAPRMNRVVSAARGLGVTIVHAPSSGIKFYKDTPFRQRVLAARRSSLRLPSPAGVRCHRRTKPRCRSMMEMAAATIRSAGPNRDSIATSIPRSS